MNYYRYGACKMLVEDLWFVEGLEWCDDERGAIDFSAIETAVERVGPSTTEALRLELAEHLWTGGGTVDLARLIDHADYSTRQLVIDALATYLGFIDRTSGVGA